VPPQVEDWGTLPRYSEYWGNKIPRADLKTDLRQLPRGNQDLGRSGNCKWEAALAKLIISGDEVSQYSYRSETYRRRWQLLCRLAHCGVEGKEKTPHCDLIAATKEL
jgi:hypothetical protein